MTEQAFFTVKQLAERWQLDPMTIRRYIREGKLTPLRLGDWPNARVRIPAEQVAAWEGRGQA